MAKEIGVTLRVTVANGNYTDQFTPQPITIDQSTQGAAGGIIVVDSDEQILDVGDVVTEGVVWLRNLSTSSGDWIDYGPAGEPSSGGATMIPFGRIKGGEFQFFRLYPGVEVVVSGNDTMKLQYVVQSD